MLPRTIRLLSTTTGCTGSGPLPLVISNSTALENVAAMGWSIAVSCGLVKRVTGELSKLTSDRSSGARKPILIAVSSTASAI